MRNLLIAASCMVITSLAPVAYAQQAANERPIPVQHSQRGPVVRNVVVVDMERLPLSIQSQVYSAISRVSDEQLQALRRSLDAIPAASVALKEQGKSSDEVVAAAIDEDGDLTLITMTTV
jgi:hypothetical protein